MLFSKIIIVNCTIFTPTSQIGIIGPSLMLMTYTYNYALKVALLFSITLLKFYNYITAVVLQHSKIRLRMNSSRSQACNFPTDIFWGNPCIHCFLFNLRSSRLTAWLTRTHVESTQYNRTTACSICALACHPFRSDCIWLVFSSFHLWISEDQRLGVDSNHQDRQQEKQNKFFLHFHGQAVCSSALSGRAQMRVCDI